MPPSQPESSAFPTTPQEPFSLIVLGRVLSVRRRTVVYCTTAGVLLALFISLLLPTRFTSSALLEFNQQNATALESPAAETTTDHVESAVTLSTQARILQSDDLALQSIKKLDLERIERQRTFFHFGDTAGTSLSLEQSPARRGRILRAFHRRLSVEVIGGTRLIEIKYADRDPALAAAVVNTLIDDYLNQYFQTRYTATKQASDWLSRELTALKTDVESSQQRLADYQRDTGILGESETNNVIIAKLEDLNKQLSAAESNRIVKEAVWQLARSGDPELISSMAGTSLVPGIANNAVPLGVLPTLRTQEAQLKSDIAQTSARLGPSFPKLVQMRAQLTDLQASIQTELGKIAARAENDYLAAKNAEDMERALFDKQKQEANKLNDSAVQYGILKREADANRDLYQGLLGKLKEASVLGGLHSSEILVVDAARLPDKPSRPSYPLNLFLGTFCGLFIGVSVALFQDSTDRTLRSPEDIARITQVPTIAVIPARTEKNLPEMNERFRALRTRLLPSGPRVLVISSPLPHDGKTTVGLHLARSLAALGRRVLLVDADLHRPSLHRFLKIANAAGLSELLADDNAPTSISATFDGLHVLVAGAATSNSSDRLVSPRMAALVAQWRTQFDDILFDTPPVLAYTDALLLSNLGDAVLLVVRAGQTSSDALLRSLEVFAHSNATVAGAVINALDFRSPHYKHYYGHAYRSLHGKAL